MTGNRTNCSLWYWLRRPTEFNHLILYCNAFGWRYFWRDTFPLSWAEWLQLIGLFGMTAQVLLSSTAPLFPKIGLICLSVIVVARIARRHGVSR